MSNYRKLPAKEIERLKLNRFAELSMLLSNGDIYNFEEPDFVIYQPNRILGIELTDLFWEEKTGIIPQQAVESLRWRIAESAGRIYDEFGLPPLYACIHFNQNYIPHKDEVSRVSIAIAKVVAANVPDEGDHYHENYNWQNRNYFPEEVERIGVSRFFGIDRTFFAPMEASFIPDLETKDIERTLARKESKLKEYRNWCDEVWLLINCDIGQLSTDFAHDSNIFSKEFSSGFDRAFLLRHMADKIHELKLLPQSLIAPPTR